MHGIGGLKTGFGTAVYGFLRLNIIPEPIKDIPESHTIHTILELGIYFKMDVTIWVYLAPFTHSAQRGKQTDERTCSWQ